MRSADFRYWYSGNSVCAASNDVHFSPQSEKFAERGCDRFRSRFRGVPGGGDPVCRAVASPFVAVIDRLLCG